MRHVSPETSRRCTCVGVGGPHPRRSTAYACPRQVAEPHWSCDLDPMRHQRTAPRPCGIQLNLLIRYPRLCNAHTHSEGTTRHLLICFPLNSYCPPQRVFPETLASSVVPVLPVTLTRRPKASTTWQGVVVQDDIPSARILTHDTSSPPAVASNAIGVACDDSSTSACGLRSQ
ncbi:hypothetical protein LZ30DRAFT_189638 [Colletotrichum cereale]|nr:hypothetical protein LZ30DRAFT_189638 [Colletotrichum cereale]